MVKLNKEQLIEVGKETIQRRNRQRAGLKNLVDEVSGLLLGVTFLFMKAVLIGLLGMGSYLTIILINGITFKTYALFACCFISGVLWLLLPNCHEEYFKGLNKHDKSRSRK